MSVKAGSWVSWRKSSGTGKGKVTSVHTASTVPAVPHKVVGSATAPAARIKVYERDGETWKPTGSYTAAAVSDLTVVDELVTAAAEAIAGKLSVNDLREMLCAAVEDRVEAVTGAESCYVYVQDFTDTDVVYQVGWGDDLFQAPYTVDNGAVTLGDAMPVLAQTVYVPIAGGDSGAATSTEAPADATALDQAAEGGAGRATESVDRLVGVGRVIEARGTDDAGGRVFRVQLIAYGDSKNGRRYPEQVMREAVGLYEGAKAYDHHRSDEELRTSTISGLVGSYRDVAATDTGIEADLHLLPSATHAAEALDASLVAQEQGLQPLVGLSQDVRAHFTPVVDGNRRLQEATKIVAVQSTDLVAEPSAGGHAIRAVAGGTAPTETEEIDVPVSKTDVLDALKDATDDELAGVGLARAATSTTDTPPAEGGTAATEAVNPAALSKTDFLGRLLIKEKVTAAGLPERITESLAAGLPDRITESDVDAAIKTLKGSLAVFERAQLAPTVTTVVAQEAFDKKRQGLDDFFEGNGKGYLSFRGAFVDITGRSPRAFDEDFNQTIMRECVGGHYDSAASRATESLSSTSFDQLLGDSITRRMVAEYGRPSLQTWRQIVSSTPTLTDFRTQRIGRVGGYGTLPAVNQGAAYQPLTSPTDEEATYAVTKRGGTEDLTLEMIANDDVRAISKIPFKLGLAAAQTLYRFVWDILPTNAAVTYDGVALFNAGHGNTDNPAVLGQTTLSAGRVKMRQQTAYNDTKDVLSIIPRFLVVPSALEELAFQLCTSAVAIPATPAGPSNTPNLHQGMQPIVIDYYSDTNDWYIVCDPSLCPTIEIGFYLRQDPELFTQADPTVGSMFNIDALTYKIRHIYSGAVLDHRGFYRGNN